MSETPKVKGPASYFPSIEKTYGKPISHWMEILKQAGELKHMKLVSLLKTKHELVGPAKLKPTRRAAVT